MKTIVSTLALIFLLCFAMAGCKKDSNKSDTPVTKNFLKVDGTEFAISKGILENYGGDSSVFNIDLSLISSGITIHETLGMPDSSSGTGHVVYFEMFSSSVDKLAIGDYAFNNTMHAGTFDGAEYVLNWNIAQQHNPNFIQLASGTVKVIKSGAEYELTFSGTDQNNKTISGSYKGSLKYYNYAKGKKSSKVKRLWN
jgi:hypothetical protein